MKSLFSKMWLSSAVIITLVCGLIYAVAQQNLRQNANDPQIQLAEDMAKSMESGKSNGMIFPPSVDISQSLAIFVMNYDDAGTLLNGTAQLGETHLSVPKGVLEFTKQHGQDRVTWQPKAGVRAAIVAVHYGGNKPGVIVVGRSLREVEKREHQLAMIVGIGWVSLLLCASIVPAILGRPSSQKK